MRIGGAASSSTVSWTPLVLTLGLHLLLVLAWLLRPGMPAALPAAAERATVLVLLAPSLRPAPPRQPPLRTAPAKAAPRPPAPRAPPLAAPDTPAALASAEAPVESELVQGDPGPASAEGDLLATSRAMAGRVDRELRQGGSPITAEPERKWERFAAAVAAARNGGSMAATLDRHTADDGVTIYRKTVGNVVRCYRSGSVGGIGPADGQTAGNIRCPSGVRWTRI